jgi:uncharacterized MnhB-related membrane protein
VIFLIGQIIIGIALIVIAIWSIITKDLIHSVVRLGAFSLLISVEYFLLQSPDVAIAEAAVGAGLSTVIYVFAIRQTKRMEE